MTQFSYDRSYLPHQEWWDQIILEVGAEVMIDRTETEIFRTSHLAIITKIDWGDEELPYQVTLASDPDHEAHWVALSHLADDEDEIPL